jgi:hypothetical protein
MPPKRGEATEPVAKELTDAEMKYLDQVEKDLLFSIEDYKKALKLVWRMKHYKKIKPEDRMMAEQIFDDFYGRND